MSYNVSEHRRRFAVWAVVRASQRGFTSVIEPVSRFMSSGVWWQANTHPPSWVGFEWREREAFIPAGSICATTVAWESANCIGFHLVWPLTQAIEHQEWYKTRPPNKALHPAASVQS